MNDVPESAPPANQPPPKAIRASGNETRTLYIDAIEAAMRIPGRRGANMPRNLAEDVLLRQLSQCERIRKQIDRHLTKSIKANEDWVPPVEIVESTAKNTQAIRGALSELRALRKDAKEARKGLTDDQLDKVLVHSLRRIAPNLNDEQKWEFIAGMCGVNVANATVPSQAQEAA